MFDIYFMRLALRLARRGYGMTSPNPMVGAVLVKGGKAIGRGWHRRAGGPHAEIEALRDAHERNYNPRGATLYVTLEPCCTHGRTPPCTEAIIAAGIKRVVVGATDPNPGHSGKGFTVLKRAGIKVALLGEDRTCHSVRAGWSSGGRRRAWSDAPYHRLTDECAKLNEAFNHWIVHRTPFVTVKAAMTLDGKIATASGESKWITGGKARAYGMKLRQGNDAVLVGINTVLADDPSLTARATANHQPPAANARLRRIVLDSMARTPPTAKVASDEHAALTTVVVSKLAPKSRVAVLAKRVKVLVAPVKHSLINLRWLLRKLGADNVTHLLVEGGGEVNASFLLGGLAHRVAFFYAPKILGGRDSRKGVAGGGAKKLSDVIQLCEVEWRRLGPDLLLLARVNLAGKSR
ncbi:MAG: bifunctional diaminohydroxyphosphoribosylaminopyrimidine deaminase/5-amino-6-(5-phosphoribosylamino)uracil reductase RibD [Verrucomicrobia bacterium]|jgi:diaminohydroxyphosphoribosylaminopyrimidine deaminase/5-amino-6-(5-phosphoribosylamino)uracil reductase|nr:bifunctional diaminohydroxyphosphoribosylaminopyrimidine deaminase/5-amino-6-(5-phosphoribosylamino)uracil reductase RibD [Verrucomicrobiota bacterium]